MRFYPLGKPPGYDPGNWLSGCLWTLFLLAIIVFSILACVMPISTTIDTVPEYRRRPYVVIAVEPTPSSGEKWRMP